MKFCCFVFYFNRSVLSLNGIQSPLFFMLISSYTVKKFIPYALFFFLYHNVTWLSLVYQFKRKAKKKHQDKKYIKSILMKIGIGWRATTSEKEIILFSREMSWEKKKLCLFTVIIKSIRWKQYDGGKNIMYRL